MASIGYPVLRRLLDENAQLVEVFPADEYAEMHLPGAVSIPLKALDEDTTAGLDRGRPVVVYCWDALCDMSPRAACRLATFGFTDVHDYVAGKADWLGRNLPVHGSGVDNPTIGRRLRHDVVTKRSVPHADTPGTTAPRTTAQQARPRGSVRRSPRRQSSSR